MKTAARAVTIALLVASWLAMSNHCAFAAIAPKPAAAQSDCPFHSKPAQPQPAPTAMQCCKVLRALSPAAKTIVRASFEFGFVDLAFVPIAVLPPAKIAFAVSALDTGPPASSFAESILQRSLLAHAPPVGA